MLLQEFGCNGTVLEHPGYGTLLLQEFACNGTVLEHPEYGTLLLPEFACNGTLVGLHPISPKVRKLEGS